LRLSFRNDVGDFARHLIYQHVCGGGRHGVPQPDLGPQFGVLFGGKDSRRIAANIAKLPELIQKS
jgi:hypothetical protein